VLSLFSQVYCDGKNQMTECYEHACETWYMLLVLQGCMLPFCLEFLLPKNSTSDVLVLICCCKIIIVVLWNCTLLWLSDKVKCHFMVLCLHDYQFSVIMPILQMYMNVKWVFSLFAWAFSRLFLVAWSCPYYDVKWVLSNVKWVFSLFAWLCSVFLSHKSANSTFSRLFSAQANYLCAVICLIGTQMVLFLVNRILTVD
jgi:hypothetical protein